MTPYDPIESLREEVNRFLATNTFTPMLVTGFYVQAKVVLAEVDRLRQDSKRLKEINAELLEACREALGMYEVQLQLEAADDPTCNKLRSVIEKAYTI